MYIWERRRQVSTKRFVVFTFMVVYFSIAYVNYNLPAFKQISAYLFYVPVQTNPDNKIKSELGWCIMPSCHTPLIGNFYGRNTSPCDLSTKIENYKYQVGENTYVVAKNSYFRKQICHASKNTVYYFPLYPAWSVIDNSFPKGKVFSRFFITTMIFSMLLFSYFGFILIMRDKKYSLKAIYHEIKNDKKPYYRIVATWLPFIIIALYSLFSIDGYIQSFNKNIGDAYEPLFELLSASMILSVVFLPSIFLFMKFFEGHGRFKYILSFLSTVTIFFAHQVLISLMPIFLP